MMRELKLMGVLMVVLMVALIFTSTGIAGEEDWLWEADINLGSDASSAGYNAFETDLLEVQTGNEAGLLTRIAFECDESDDWIIYIYDQDIANWSTNVDRLDNDKTIWSYDSSTTGRRDTDLYSYSTDNGVIYVGYYNDDESLSSFCTGHLEGENWNRDNRGTFSSE